jgi:hypothetical protein
MRIDFFFKKNDEPNRMPTFLVRDRRFFSLLDRGADQFTIRYSGIRFDKVNAPLAKLAF